jgi:hypothetical protein
MDVSKAEAAAALAAVREAQSAARAAFRAHHGHFHFWIWGLIWIAMAIAAQTRGEAGVRLFPWFSAAGMLLSITTGFLQSGQVRQPLDRRFLGAMAALVGFAAILPCVFGLQHVSAERVFAYTALVVAECYVVAGLWFDTYLTWTGVLLAALILAGLFFFSGIFWFWIAVCCGGTLVGTGLYVRFLWR